MTRPATRRLPLLLAAPLTLALVACGSVSTANFKGEQHDVAQAIANLQTDERERSQQKVCSQDLARAVVGSLHGQSGCERAVKALLTQIDGNEVTVESVHVMPAARPPTAQARVRSTYSGNEVRKTVNLVKEGGRWRLSGLQ